MLEIPTPQHSVYDAMALGIDPAKTKTECPLRFIVMFTNLPINGIIELLNACGTFIDRWNWFSR
jgi:hypothetical protein